jgi:hypothetical protein
MPEMDGAEIPPMDDEGMGDEMGNEMQDAGNEEMPTDFDSNFDAGVEADEETDPKRFIQQLTGKLSQSLNSYNNENGEPDTELGKYVLGMLVKQGVKGMDEKDKKEIIKKINTDDSEDFSDDMGDDMSGDMSDDMGDDMNNSEETPGDAIPDMPDNMGEMQNESKTLKFTKKQIFESFGLTMQDESNTPKKEEPDTKITPDTKKGGRNKPFEAPTKFK